jgi:Rrf2 family nitric oxide-sensitive transcriptional repressor
MQLTKQTDYAFRLLMFLAKLPEGELAQIQQVCDFHNISSNHLAKVVVKLSRMGWITAYRGKGGGMTLAKPPADIRLDEVVKAFETTMAPVNCEQPPCSILAGCELKGILFEAMRQFMAELSKYTLADLLRDPSGYQVIKIT